MNLEVEIYMKKIIKFFDDNPNELQNIIPIERKDEFFEKIKYYAQINVENFNEPTISRKQIIEICVQLNEKSMEIDIQKNILVTTKWATYSLN